MDPNMIAMIVVGIVSVVSPMLHNWLASKAGVAPVAPATPVSPAGHPLLQGALAAVLEAAKAGKLTADHPLLSVIQVLMASVPKA